MNDIWVGLILALHFTPKCLLLANEAIKILILGLKTVQYNYLENHVMTKRWRCEQHFTFVVGHGLWPDFKWSLKFHCTIQCQPPTDKWNYDNKLLCFKNETDLPLAPQPLSIKNLYLKYIMHSTDLQQAASFSSNQFYDHDLCVII